VRIYGDARCTGTPLGAGERGRLGAFSIPVNVPDNSMTTFAATVTDT